MKPGRLRHAGVLSAAAVVVPMLLIVLFVPLFHYVQGIGVPEGSLQGIDMTRFAIRDRRMIDAFNVLVLAVAAAIGAAASSWRARIIVWVIGAVAAYCASLLVFAMLFAG